MRNPRDRKEREKERKGLGSPRNTASPAPVPAAAPLFLAVTAICFSCTLATAPAAPPVLSLASWSAIAPPDMPGDPPAPIPAAWPAAALPETPPVPATATSAAHPLTTFPGTALAVPTLAGLSVLAADDEDYVQTVHAPVWFPPEDSVPLVVLAAVSTYPPFLEDSALGQIPAPTPSSLTISATLAFATLPLVMTAPAVQGHSLLKGEISYQNTGSSVKKKRTEKLG